MSSKSILEEDLIILYKVLVGRNDLEVARCVFTSSGEGLDMVYMEIYPECFFESWDLRVDGRYSRVIRMLEHLRRTARTRLLGKRIKVFCGSKPPKVFIHFKNIEDFLHWVFAHGGYITKGFK